MNIQQRIFNFIAQLTFERPGRKQSLDEFIDRLQAQGDELAGKMVETADTPKNRKQITHITGIERWSQRRLQMLLGEPAIDDEYDGYQPPADADWPALRQALTDTRTETVSIVQSLQQQGIPLTSTAPHNTFGPLTARAWLQYLVSHANLETRSLRNSS